MTFLETIEKNRQSFLNFNRKKYERFQMLISDQNALKVINTVPFLLSVNDPKIPGYVQGPVPVGIFGYYPEEDILKFAESKFHLQKAVVSNATPFIQMLAVLGSVGTIAYTKNSDCDYWACVNKNNVSAEELAKLQQKVDAIQNWVMEESGKEIHVFLNDIDSLKNNIYAEDEDEAFGSTIGATLKDEFYRSSIIIAGKIPFWWVVPNMENEKYDNVFKSVPDDIKNQKYINLGNLYSIPKDDFLGAALFQLIKALGNPFKSILKIGVLEKYLFGPPLPHLLCHKIKESIHKGEFYAEILDSYIMMFEAVYEYYGETMNNPVLLNALKRNLYLKINPQLTKYAGLKNSKNIPYKVQIMSKYVLKWGWTPAEIKDLDNFDNWDYMKILNFWNIVKKFMLLSYQRISKEIPNLDLEHKISETDFKLLSHKIMANFIPDESCIDKHITFKDAPYESIIYIEPSKLTINDEEWRVYKRNIEIPRQTTTLKVGNNLVKLLAWIAINHIFDPVFSRVQIQSGYTRVDQSLVQDILTQMTGLFNKKSVSIKTEYFLAPAFTINTMLIINFNNKDGRDINSIYYLYKTSWGQAFIKHYTNPAIILAVLKTMISDGMKLRLPYENCCTIHTPDPFRKEYKNLSKIFKDAYTGIIESDPDRTVKFIGRLMNDLIIISKDNGQISVSRHPNIISILSALSFAPGFKVSYIIHPDEPQLKFLPDILKQQKENSISIIYENKGNFTFFYVINEGGNIFCYITKDDMKKTEQTIIALCEFLRHTIPMVNRDSLLISLNNEIELIRMVHTKDGISFANDNIYLKNLYVNKADFGKLLNVEIKNDGNGKFNYSVIFPSGERTPFVPVEKLAEAVKEIRNTAGTSGLTGNIRFMSMTKKQLLLGTGLYLSEKMKLDTLLSRVLQ